MPHGGKQKNVHLAADQTSKTIQNFPLPSVMEKCKSFPRYSSSFSREFGFQDRSNSYSFNGPSQKGSGFSSSNNPELQRRRRVAAYNLFTMEGKLKCSMRNSFKWIKGKFSDVRYGM